MSLEVCTTAWIGALKGSPERNYMHPNQQRAGSDASQRHLSRHYWLRDTTLFVLSLLK